MNGFKTLKMINHSNVKKYDVSAFFCKPHQQFIFILRREGKKLLL